MGALLQKSSGISQGTGATPSLSGKGTGSPQAAHTISQSIKVQGPKDMEIGMNLNSINKASHANSEKMRLKFSAGIGANNAGKSAPNLGASLIGKMGGDIVGELNKNKTGNALQLAGAGVSAAGACVSIGATVSSIITTGAISSASLGPFFWVGLIVTVVAAGVATIATAVTNENKKVATEEDASYQKRVDNISKLNSKGQPDILNSDLESKVKNESRIAGSVPSNSGPSSSVMATMDVAHSAQTA